MHLCGCPPCMGKYHPMLNRWDRVARDGVLFGVCERHSYWYSANGMSDGMLMGCLLGATDGMMTYLYRNRLESLAVGAIWLAAAFLFRYEAVPFFAVTGTAMVISIKRLRRSTAEVEAMFVLYAMPMVYAVMAWMFLNWLIMKNPLYF